MGFYEQLRGLMCQNRGLLNTREQRNNGGNIRQGQLIFFFIVMFHKENAAAPKEFIFAAWVWIVPVFLIAHRDIPSAQLMAPLHSNLVQYSPTRQRRRGRCQILILLLQNIFKMVSSPSLLSASITSSSDVHRSNCINLPIVQWPRVIARGWIIVWSVSGIQKIWHFSVRS